jgi:hypothetical protein
MNATHTPPAAILHACLHAAQEQLADDMRALVHRAAPDLIERLDFDDDDTFLEPLLFAYFSNPTPPMALDQILFGYLPPTSWPFEITVRTDAQGAVELPRMGRLRTHVADGQLQLRRTSDGSLLLSRDGVTIGHVVEPVRNIPGTAIELCEPDHPLLARLFVDDQGHPASVERVSNEAERIDQLGRAWSLLARHAPDYHEQMLMVTRRVCVYRGAQPFSFAAMAAHGIAFLNTPAEADEAFFIEDLVHQCGHMVFSALTLHDNHLLAVAPDLPLREITGHPLETRSVFEALHGVFTETRMNECLDACCDAPHWSAAQRHELLGRFALILTRFGVDLKNLARDGLFEQQGRELIAWSAGVYSRVAQKRYSLLASLDISNQPYAFSLERFLERNAPGA